MNPLLHPIILPLITGLICLILPRRVKGVREGLGLVSAGATFYWILKLFAARPLEWSWDKLSYLSLRIDNLSSFVLLFIALFGILVILYSIKFMAGKPRSGQYYAYLLWTLAASYGAVMANDLVLLLVFWGFLGLTLYLLIGIAGPQSADAAKKTLIIVGGSDALMILGVAVIYALTKSLAMSQAPIPLSGELSIAAFLCLAIAAFAKAGAMPLHSWVPDCAEKAPIPVTAFLPASLDKLVGIYLLARISLDLFVITGTMGLLLMIIGAITIMAAVMMALIQHDFKRLLGYHAVSQVGYMVLGIGTGNPIGIAGGLFHMLNNTIYKSGLFLAGGAIEMRKGTTNLNRLGGLARIMPVTFITCLIAALSISGVPPFNGFFSKWMIYQGVVELGKQGDKLWFIWLIAAMLGSALTLASFIKLIYAAFLAPPSKTEVNEPAEETTGKRQEVSWTMWLPMVVLASLCIGFGVFAYQWPLKYFIGPAVEGSLESITGFWSPRLATLFIFAGLILGGIIYLLGNVKKTVREDDFYAGGETLPEMRVSGVDFYQTIKEMNPFSAIYEMASQKLFDLYDQGIKFVFFFTRKLQALHAGILPIYLIWCLLGMLILFFAFFRGGG